MTPYVPSFTAGAPVLIDGGRPAAYVAPETRQHSRVRLASGVLGVVRNDRLSAAPEVAAALGYDLAARAAEYRQGTLAL